MRLADVLRMNPWGRGSRGTPRAGFTLIELLVVVAIIGLLMAILLPALGQVREMGRRSKCLSNLRQIAIAWQYYLDDVGRGQFPLYHGHPNLVWHYGGKMIGRVWTGHQDFNPRPLNPYLGLDPSGNRLAEVFHCPSDRGMRDPQDPTTIGQTTYERLGNSYPMNGSALAGEVNPITCQPIRPPKPVRVSDIDYSPGIFVLAGDQQWYYTIHNNHRYSAIWHDQDGTNLNLAFLDGHAAFTRLVWGEAVTSWYSFATTICLEEDEDEGEGGG